MVHDSQNSSLTQICIHNERTAPTQHAVNNNNGNNGSKDSRMKQSSMKSLLVTAIAFGALVTNLSQAFVMQTTQSCRSPSASANSPSWMLQAVKDDSNSDDSIEEPPSNKKNEGGGLFQGISNFFSELDAFIDDATVCVTTQATTRHKESALAMLLLFSNSSAFCNCLCICFLR